MANAQAFVRDRRLSKRLSSLLYSNGYVAYSTCPGDNRAFYTFRLDADHKLDKTTLFKLGVMPHQMYWHIVGSAPNEHFAAKELLAHFGVNFMTQVTTGESRMNAVQINPQHAARLRDEGVDVGRLGQGPEVPKVMSPDLVNAAPPVFDDEDPGTPEVAAELSARTAAVEGAAPQIILPSAEEPPPPTVPAALPPEREIPEGKVEHVGTINREDLDRERGKPSKESKFFDQH